MGVNFQHLILEENRLASEGEAKARQERADIEALIKSAIDDLNSPEPPLRQIGEKLINPLMKTMGSEAYFHRVPTDAHPEGVSIMETLGALQKNGHPDSLGFLIKRMGDYVGNMVARESQAHQQNEGMVQRTWNHHKDDTGFLSL